MRFFECYLALFTAVFGVLNLSLISEARTFQRSLQTTTDSSGRLAFSVTYRDFLPGICLFDDTPTFSGLQFILEEWGYDLSEMRGTFEFYFYEPPQADTVRIGSCALGEEGAVKIKEIFQNFTIRGHPDFEALGFLQELERKCTGVAINGSCVEDEGGNVSFSLVADELKIGDNGLPKVTPCSDDDGVRCGLVRGKNGVIGFANSNKNMFNKWYNDDLDFNKRLGQRLFLEQDENSPGIFTFDSGNEENDLSNDPGMNDAPDFGEDTDRHFFGPLTRFKTDGRTLLEVANAGDLFDSEAWPDTIQHALIANTADRSYWFTTELHTTFEFRNDSDMKFEFTGDDDFWAFIGGKMVIDLGSTHRALTASVDLNQEGPLKERLKLEHGEIYTLDIFHAERQTSKSSFKMSTTLFEACNVQQSGSIAIDPSQDVSRSFVMHPSVSYDASQNSFHVQKSGSSFTSGFFFSKIKENVGRGFIAEFEVRVDPAAETDGFAFVVQAEGVEDYPVTSGPTFSIDGISKSFAVVFDLCGDRADGSCSLQTVSLHHRNSSELGLKIDNESRTKFDRIHRRLARDETFPVQIIHYGGRPNFLEVYVRGSLYLREEGLDLTSILNGTGAHVGITAGSSASSTDIFISNFSLKVVEVDPLQTDFIDDFNFSNQLQEIIANGVNVSDGFTIRTADFCDNQLESGTLTDLISAKYIEKLNESTGLFFNGSTQGTFVDATLIDNDDGTYTIALKTTSPGFFSLAVAFGEGCIVNVSHAAEISNGTEIISPFPSLFNSTPDCFYKEFNDGAIVVVASAVIRPDDDFDDVPLDDGSDRLVLIISIVAACTIILGVFLAIVMVKYRNQWYRDKGHIAPGQLFQAELGTKYDPMAEYSVIGGKLVATQQEILELQSKQVSVNSKLEQIAELEAKNQEMKDIIKAKKLDLEAHQNAEKAIEEADEEDEDEETELEWAREKRNEKKEL